MHYSVSSRNRAAKQNRLERLSSLRCRFAHWAFGGAGPPSLNKEVIRRGTRCGERVAACCIRTRSVWDAHLDVVDVDSACNGWHAVQLPDIVLQVGHLMDEVAVTLEVHLQGPAASAHSRPSLHALEQLMRSTPAAGISCRECSRACQQAWHCLASLQGTSLVTDQLLYN